jgi:hypothetical protein
MVRLITLSAVLFLAACGTTDPISVGDYMKSWVATPSVSPVIDDALAQIDFRRIIFTGSIQTSVTCVDLYPKLVADGKDITLTVEEKLRPVPCADVLGYFTYRVITGNFHPATYRVKVVYKTASGTRTIVAGPVVLEP